MNFHRLSLFLSRLPRCPAVMAVAQVLEVLAQGVWEAMGGGEPRVLARFKVKQVSGDWGRVLRYCRWVRSQRSSQT